MNRTKLVDRLILPLKECWVCKKTFQETEKQLKHFSEFHSCKLCGDNFEDKNDHIRNFHCQYCMESFKGDGCNICRKSDHELDCNLNPNKG